MKKLHMLLTAGLVAAAAAALAEFVILPVDAPVADAYKEVPTHLVGVGKVIGIEGFNVVSNKTILLQRIMPDASTNTVSTQTTTVTTGGNQTFDLSSSGYFWVQRGETWRRAGTETNGTVRLIVEQ
jgi:hypothetical protein